MLGAAALLSLSPLATAAPDPEVAALIRELGLIESPTPSREYPGWTKPAKIVVRTASPAQQKALEAVAPGVEIVGVRNEQEALAAMPGAQGLVGFCEPELIDAAPELGWIQTYHSGVADCAALLADRDIVLTNMQRAGAPGIAEHAIALLLGLTRGLHLYLPDQAEGRWEPGRLRHANAHELSGRTMLVVGLGGIGTEVARRAHGLGMRVIATRGSRAGRPEFVARVGTPEDLLAFAAEADVVVSAVPLLPATEGLFDREFFETLKPGARFINVSRGRVVVQDELVRALESGRLAGAGLDVTDPEPLPPEHPLWRRPDVIITPHVAATSDGLFGRVGTIARENLRRWVAGEPLLSVVDTERGY